ncbi:choice-of-anchor I domain-containing protein [Cyanobium sp. CH-040]|uniref:choice-of-anchor I domain-containing protein n=1 Tax=Cyanobium sp. CH-040 TaxID=2823708 RepID=UPI0020CF8E4B|nr:hypothetical protein [Cyanobium sp. CH-040]MCP9928261.1 hypothetical protein [Cyanobium sp. CH-040]
MASATPASLPSPLAFLQPEQLPTRRRTQSVDGLERSPAETSLLSGAQDPLQLAKAGSPSAIANRPFQPGRPGGEAPADPILGQLNLTLAGGPPQAEISASVGIGGRFFVLSIGGGNTLQVSEATDPANPTLLTRQDLGPVDTGTVATFGNLVAVGLSPAGYRQATSLDEMRGLVRFFRLGADGSLTFLEDVPVGFLPDGMAFNANGTKLVIANEGEANWGPEAADGSFPEAYSVDPVGSIGIIDITARGRSNPNFRYTDLGFEGLALPAGLRLTGPAGTTAAQDIEPEYVTIVGNTAFVSLQENNGIARVNLATNTIEGIFDLGRIDYTQVTVDISDQDGPGGSRLINPQRLPADRRFFGLRMPDGIDAFSQQNGLFVLTANEGDSRIYPDVEDQELYSDEERSRRYAESLYRRLKTLDDTGNPDERVNSDTSFGSRSISLFDGLTGQLLWDSGDALQNIAIALGQYDDGRSDDKGVEPEAVVNWQDPVTGRRYAIAAPERTILGDNKTFLAIFDITDQDRSPRTYRVKDDAFVTALEIAGSEAAEGLLVVPASQSPTGRDMLMLSNEGSSTVDFLDLGAMVRQPWTRGSINATYLFG